MTRKFVTIDIKGESNIGVIDIGLTDKSVSPIQVRENIEPKLIEALESHFDCPVKIVSVNIITNSDMGAIELGAYVLIESDDSDYYENVSLKETWVY